ncbi:hypothetical protein QJS04_geneDACA011076 [Acorus gramineus]|uniref:Uncharacterized protein n=1 Tax=Acorus gramineus TaxID=55184 RepID=A0AAV9BI04_ACOGR|nr:hypothetical protein QJS04_geneDACA011076 [Acorus gramineus]
MSKVPQMLQSMSLVASSQPRSIRGLGVSGRKSKPRVMMRFGMTVSRRLMCHL